MLCEVCKRETNSISIHHVIPKIKGGNTGETIECCLTCSQQIHMLFTVGELSHMTLSELLKTEEMAKYISWVKTKPRDFSMKQSLRIKRRK